MKMKQTEINKVLDAFLNKDITMKEAETKLLNLFSVGRSYFIEENGKKLEGKIMGITKKGLEVYWSDGETTFENKINPKHVV
tara:strand:+ start:2504 stop:2749 length:246 start_codon:yes stop_codon:yes gene_type:complete